MNHGKNSCKPNAPDRQKCVTGYTHSRWDVQSSLAVWDGNAAVSLQRHAAHEVSYCAFTVCDTRAVDEHYSLSWPPKLEVIEPKGHVTHFRGINCAFLHLLSARKDLL